MTELYLTKATIREYYKEEIVPWVQPILTHNDVIGGATFACEMRNNPVNPAFQALDGNVSTNARISSGASSSSEFIFYNPNPLKIQTLTIDGTGNANNEYMSAGLLYGSNDGIEWVDLATFSGLSYTAYTVQVNSSEFYKYHKLMPTGLCTSGYWTLAELAIVAEEKITVKGSASDYTFYLDKEVVNSSIFKDMCRKYYKRLWRKWDYTPALTSNDSDSNFIVSADTWYTFNGGGYYPWRSFAKSKDYVYPWLSANKATGWYQIKTTAKLRIYAITIKNREYDGNTGSMQDFEIFGSLDGVTWESIGRFYNDYYENGGQYTIDVQSKKAYYYHKFEIYSHNQTTDWCSIGFPTIYADEEYDKVEVSEDDEYDFYEDFPADIGAVSYPEVKYFRRGEEANVELYGTLQNRGGKIGNYKVVDEAGVESIITEFKSGNYAITPKYPTAVTSYEVVLKFKTFAHNEGRVIGNYKNNVWAPQVEVSTSATAYNLEWLHPNGSSWVIVSANSSDLVLGEWYWLKATWDGQNVRVYASTDGENYTFRNYKAITSCSWKEQVEFGADVNAYFLNGEIDLKECYMILNGKMWWHGTHPVECSKEEAEWSELVNIGKPIN